MPKNKNVTINYTSREFDSIKSDLVDYAKRYYPNSYNDFTFASFGSLIFDTVAYAGDILSYYLDYHVNESFLETSLEFDNIRKHARSLGYKFAGSPSSYGIVSLFILIPANTDGTAPDTSYLPILKSGTNFSSNVGGNFILTEDVNFADPVNDVIAARFNETTGATTYFAVRAFGQVQSGVLQSSTINLEGTNFSRFRKVRLGGNDITEIISVYDSQGNRYYEVESLSQEVIFVDTTNNTALSDGVRSILKPFATARRFVLEQDDSGTYLQFGFGSEETDDGGLTDPSRVALKMTGKNYISSKSFDPTKLITTDKLGISPYNTELTIVSRKNTTEAVAVPANSINSVADKNLVFEDIKNLDQREIDFISNSIEVSNENPITSLSSDISVSELKERAKAHYAAQGRAVTKQDYESLVYNMPRKFGAVCRANIINDPSATNRKLSLYVISENSDGHLAETNIITKNNLKNWLNQYRSLNDQIEMFDANVLNFSIDFTVVSDKRHNRDVVMRKCVNEIKDMFSMKFYIGEPLYITSVMERLIRVDGVIDVRKVKIHNKARGLYSPISIDMDKILSKDGTYYKTPENCVLELKFPDEDIKGMIK